MSLRGQRVLITGSEGFIGSHLAEALVAAGAKVRAFVLYNSFNSWGWLESLPSETLAELDVFSGDVRDASSVRRAMEGCSTVFHLAALIGIPYSYQAPASYADTNVRGTLNVLDAARELKVKKLIHTSSSEVYGSARSVPMTEEHPLRGQSPYAATKIGADALAISYHNAFGLPVTVFRPFNTYGPRQSARAVIPTVITQIANGQREIRLGSTRPTRDFLYVKDTAAAFMAVAESNRTAGEVVHAGSAREISIADAANLIGELMDVPVKIVRDPERVRPAGSEVERLCADNSKIQRLTGWKPAYAGPEGFRKGLTETIRWFTHVENLLKYKAGICNL